MDLFSSMGGCGFAEASHGEYHVCLSEKKEKSEDKSWS
jgi:hypothetical protein